MTSGNTIAEFPHTRHANSDLTHLFVPDEQAFLARWPRTAATVTTGLSRGLLGVGLLAGAISGGEVIANPQPADAVDVRTAIDIPAGSLRLVIGCETNSTFSPAIVFKSGRLVLKGIGINSDPTFVGSQVLRYPVASANVRRNNGSEEVQTDYMLTRGAPLNESSANFRLASGTDSVLLNANIVITPLSGSNFTLHADFNTDEQNCSAISPNGLYTERTVFPTGVAVPPVLLTGKVVGDTSVKVRAGGPGDTVIGNLTVTEPTGGGFVTSYPCSDSRPNTSSINYSAGQTVANGVIVKADSNGDICFYVSKSTGATHILWDQVGTTTLVQTHNPDRLLDTRPA